MECLCSINNQHVGVNLKACAVIMMDAWVTVPLQRGCQCKKNCMLMESSCLEVSYLHYVIRLVLELYHKDLLSVFP